MKENQLKQCNIDANFIIDELVRIAGADIKEIYEKDKKGHIKLKDWDKVDGKLISSITTGARTSKVKVWNKLHALELLGKHLSIFRDETKQIFEGDIVVQIGHRPPLDKEND